MTSKDSSTPSISDDFQIIDASCFKVDEPEPGLEFNLNVPCPVCTSFKNKLICAKCIQTGSFAHSQRPDSFSYFQVCQRLTTVNKDLTVINADVLARNTSSTGSIQELHIRITSLQRSVAFHKQNNVQKKERCSRSKKLFKNCQIQCNQLKKNYSDLSEHFSKIANQRSIYIRDLERFNADIERLRFVYLKELLQTHLVVDLSPETELPDKFAGSVLYIDKKNILIGPEPRLASHAALTYCVPTIQAAALFQDLWLPKPIRQHLQLSGPFLSSLPQRDNLGRVYSAVLHAIHMLCSRRGITVRTVLDELGVASRIQQSEYNPLYGLYCLGRYHHFGDFDSPSSYLLDGFFGAVTPPDVSSHSISHLARLHMEHIEQGEEVRDVTDQTNVPTTIDLPEDGGAVEYSKVDSQHPSFMTSNSDFDPWEFIGNSDTSSQTTIDSTHQS